MPQFWKYFLITPDHGAISLQAVLKDLKRNMR